MTRFKITDVTGEQTIDDTFESRGAAHDHLTTEVSESVGAFLIEPVDDVQVSMPSADAPAVVVDIRGGDDR